MNILRIPEATKKCGFGGVSSTWAKVRNDPAFPKPVKIGGITGFIESELDAYLEKKVCEFREQPTKRETASRAAVVSVASRAKKRAALADKVAA